MRATWRCRRAGTAHRSRRSRFTPGGRHLDRREVDAFRLERTRSGSARLRPGWPASQLGRQPLRYPVSTALEWFAPLAIVNSYGLFANMTTTRPEIVIEGSQDGETWSEYAFRYKPGDTDRRPPWNIPHQPRLDWQMWFAALSTANQTPWFTNLLVRLLQNAPIVGGLLENSPFPDAPPRYVRALLYDYHFASPEAHRKGAWWRRELLGTYYPAIRISKGDETE